MVTRLSQLAIVVLILAISASFLTGWAASNAVPVSSADLVNRVPIVDDFKPPECAAIVVTTLVTGTGTFSGTAANDLILGSAANDTITSGAGDDCVLAGGGDDALRAGGGTNSGGGADVLHGGPGTDTCAPEGGAPTYVSCEQQVAVHFHARLTAQQAQTGALTTKQTITAANLAASGFANNDQVLVLWYYKLATASTNEVTIDLTYNGASTTSVAVTRYDLGGAARERSSVFMTRVDLGALADFEVQLGSSSGVNAGYLEKSELLIVRLADFGVENVDWFWNKSTTNVANTTAYSGVNRAAVTWTPGAVQDWAYFAYVHHAIDSTGVNAEARVTLDGAVHSGDWTMEGEATTEEIAVSWWGYLAALSAAPHTLSMQTRDDTATAANDHRESAIFVFRTGVWANVFRNQPGTVAVALGSDVQVATVTNAISAAQPLMVWGQGNMDLNTVNTQAYIWLRRDNAVVIDPVGDTANGRASGYAFDASDEVPLTVLSYVEAVGGAQDYDLFTSQTTAGSRNLLRTGLLVWGMAVWAP